MLDGAPFTTIEAEITDRVRRAILRGELRPGMSVPQGELAEQFAVSITPVRAALRQLAAEGLINIEPFRAVSVHQPTPDELREVYEIRVLLEPAVTSKAAKLISDEALDEAEKLLERMEGSADARDWDVLNRDFHAAVVSGANTPRLVGNVLNLLGLATLGIRASGVLTQERMREANEEHREILRACRARDAERARSMTLRHLRTSRKLASGKQSP
jgi:DNA-binding GntR family transcriptional regulator